ncbi:MULTISPECIES: nuclease-related domain-containing protein [Thiomicrorhabdus]|uniref:NERD domain-containing protein n=1 Tax=Thiomicrorhabdus heinhorstiae TaxID=2748010 RepID=A0ABS0BVD2_9GAMM|nr:MULTISPECIES: nuclease-related domain-containing protein [Thiomicrorhabdus]MBF6057020.1 NERD domain-containing protein [Thiomicrorhabdus heinhorstiae]
MLFSRTKLMQWRDLINVSPVFEDPEVLAGRKAEDFLTRIVESNLKYKGVHCFVGKRVPCPEKSRRYEIDLIVLTKKQLHVIEVKNWSGSLVEENGQWIQHKLNGQSIEHDNLTDHNSAKLQSLQDYLQKHDIHIDPSYISQKVVLINPRLKISPQIQSDPNVIPRSHLDHYLQSQKGASFSERMLHSVIESCTSSETGSILLDGLFKAMPRKQLKRTIEALGSLRTWDLIGLHGGKILQGDARRISIGGQRFELEPLQRDEKIELRWKRGKLSSLFSSCVMNFAFGKTKLQKRSYRLNPLEDHILFHKAGNPQISQIDLKQIEWIKRG